MPDVPALDPKRLSSRCDATRFDFETTAPLPEPERPFGQQRALDAVQLALDIVGPGYNLFVLGQPGSSRHATVRRLLQAHAATRPPPVDWCYVNNFADANQPRALRLPAGLGAELQAAMERFVAELGNAITAALESDEYRSRIEAIEKERKQREDRELEEIAEAARSQGIALLRTPKGFAFSPTKDGQPLAPPEFDALPEAERERIAATVQGLRERLDRMSHQLPRLRRELHAREREATRDAVRLAVGHMIEELRQRFAGHAQVLAFLDAVLADVVDSGGQLHEQREDGEALIALTGSFSVSRYRVNLLVGHDSQERAPVVLLDNPTHANLVGRVDHLAHMGTLLTNFTLVKAGALHRANGGYLMLDALKVLTQPFAWNGLKRALSAGEVRIESLPQLLGWINTLPMEPQPIPLDVKVVLFGEREHYYLLKELDPEFDDLFKAAADFEDEVPRDAASEAQFAALLGSMARAQALRALDRGAVAALVDHAARMTGDARKLSTRTRELHDLLREADHAAARCERAVVTRDDVKRALDARIRRADRIRDTVHEAVRRDTLLIATAGEHIGQINGVAVTEAGGFRFGHPVRITATARVGEGELVDIERESTLGQPIHSKGVMILASYLGAKYAPGVPLSLSASLVFEQSYGPVEGDSASLAELCALLSSLAGVPIRQSLAVTGSINQHGTVQAVGAVNEKIEGFFDVCALRGLDGRQGVVIPAANVDHLMLRDDVVEAAAQGRFHIYPVATVDEAIGLLTGLAAGAPDTKGALPEGSINCLVAAKLAHMSEVRQAFGAARAREPVQAAKRRPAPLAVATKASARRPARPRKGASR